ncbi:hypothetical protein ACFXHD_13045 [Streptomyces hydrogenans]|uniref:hypothetical protein n=1 Tax=Streptomyces hydrogenans TaxID=1873719 RepID=UPI0036C91472
MELADLLVPRLRIYDTGLYVVTATSKTDQAGAGSGRFIEDRADLQLIRRGRAWYAVLRELGADGPTDPVFRALTTKGRLRKYPADRKRGNRLAEGSLNERLQLLAERAGVPYIDGKKVTSHSWLAGANTDMAAIGVPLAERNKAGCWADRSRTADEVYDRPTVSVPAIRSTKSPCMADRPTPPWRTRVWRPVTQAGRHPSSTPDAPNGPSSEVIVDDGPQAAARQGR